MSLTRKDFKSLAEEINHIIRDSKDIFYNKPIAEERESIAKLKEIVITHLIQFCREQNERFNEKKFKDYIEELLKD